MSRKRATPSTELVEEYKKIPFGELKLLQHKAIVNATTARQVYQDCRMRLDSINQALNHLRKSAVLNGQSFISIPYISKE